MRSTESESFKLTKFWRPDWKSVSERRRIQQKFCRDDNLAFGILRFQLVQAPKPAPNSKRALLRHARSAARLLAGCSGSSVYSLFLSARTILKSSILRPFFSAVASQLGVFPRPDQVSEGDKGLRYLGSTLGYFRRGGLPAIGPGDNLEALSTVTSLRLSCAKRFSSSSFS